MYIIYRTKRYKISTCSEMTRDDSVVEWDKKKTHYSAQH